VNKLVIDASVVLKWFLRDEKYGDRALDLLDRFVRGDIDLAAPSLMVYEVINGLVIAQKRGRIAEGKVLSSISGFLSLGITFVDVAGLEDRVLHSCRVYDRSAYDASYLAVAEQQSLALVTGDERLYNSTKGKAAWVKWIGGEEQGTRIK
jgi:predicted nucleic acid-binding protein